MKKLLFMIAILIFAYISYTYITNKLSPPTYKQNSPKQIIALPDIQPQDDSTCLKNATTVGHLVVPNTIIDYDVVKTINNEYFRVHDENGNPTADTNGKVTSAGAIYMDCRNKGDGSDRNAIIYGHNMKNGTGFKGLMSYKANTFFQENKYIYFGNSNKKTKWEVFSVYVTDTNFNYIQTDFESDEEYIKFLNRIKNKSRFTSDVQLTAKDHILTLSTCSYEFDDARFAIHAKLITD